MMKSVTAIIKAQATSIAQVRSPFTISSPSTASRKTARSSRSKKKKSLSEDELLDVELIIEEYAHIVSEGLASGESSQWTILTKDSKAHTQFRSALMAVCLLAAAMPATNSANASTLSGSRDTASFRITAVVPVVCNLKFNPAPLWAEGKVTLSDTTIINLGTMEILHNSPQGYKNLY